MFHCDDKCIPNWWLCDGEHDCSSGQDEISCNFNETCGYGMFKVKNGLYLSPPISSSARLGAGHIYVVCPTFVQQLDKHWLLIGSCCTCAVEANQQPVFIQLLDKLIRCARPLTLSKTYIIWRTCSKEQFCLT